ncbi:transcriptional regulator [Kitasatospora viridis]|uniref:Helix-turn-helix protein n=1 Tax=Kitasatospora viridis TaxID=281105 RepID=A0A561UBR1_9ACTN|nr:transcriptional regulator [Kitasatospora viridis]TWF96798.1 hypothetical protein FHX73_11571 [Kitasatospora viridis]
MARKPRPIDPAAGPLQAFAHDLRLVREQAGNPTYRALATTAGFGATTLSDAAGGVRPPSLEVTLAYVGACGGDTAEWEARWRELNRVLNDQRVAEAREQAPPTPDQAVPDDPDQSIPDGPDPAVPDDPSAEPAAEPIPDAAGATSPAANPTDATDATDASNPAATGSPDPDAPAPRGRRWWPAGRRGTVTAGLAAVVVVALLVVLLPMLLGDKHKQDALSCGPMPPSPTAGSAAQDFIGVTYGQGAHVRSGASLNSTTINTVPPGCRLHLTGYCLGDVVFDPTGGAPDIRWFKVYGGGVVASAIIHGNPPGTMQASDCPADTPAPSGVGLTVERSLDNPDTLQLQTTGTHLGIVGYAAFYAAAPPTPAGTSPTPASASPAPAGQAGWHQVQMVGSLSNNFLYRWQATGLTAAPQPITVVAAACLGGDGPTDAADARTAPAAGSDQPGQPVELTPEQWSTARQAACRYPNAGFVTNMG